MNILQIDVEKHLQMTKMSGFWQRVRAFWGDFVFYTILINVASIATVVVAAFLGFLILWVISWFISIPVGQVFFSDPMKLIVSRIAGFLAWVSWLYLIILHPLSDQGSSPGMASTGGGLIRTDGKEFYLASGMGGIGKFRAIAYFLIHYIPTSIPLGTFYFLYLSTYAFSIKLLIAFFLLLAIFVLSVIFSLPVGKYKSVGSLIVGCYSVRY